MAKAKQKRKYDRQEPVSLAPLGLEEALRLLLQVDPDDLDDHKADEPEKATA